MPRLLIALAAALMMYACNQNMESVNTGETLESAPKPVADPNAHPFAAPEGVPESQVREVPPFVKAYFMHMFVEALYGTPGNSNPSPTWKSPLKDATNGRVWCTDCHTSGQVNFANIPKRRLPMVDEFEKDREFMTDLMKKWVARLNSDDYMAKGKLATEVTCLTCHATQP